MKDLYVVDASALPTTIGSTLSTIMGFAKLRAQQLLEADRPFLLPGTLIAGRYELEGIISSGSFGIVYRASDHETQRQVALKTLNDQASAIPQHVGRFTREGRLAKNSPTPTSCRTDFGMTTTSTAEVRTSPGAH